MSDHNFWLSEAQFARLRPLLPNKVRGVPRVDDRRVISGIVHVLRNGLMWRDAPSAYGPHKTLYNRFVRWSVAGVFNRIFEALAAESRETGMAMIDATHLKAHRTAASLLERGSFALSRTHPRRPQLQIARGLRRRRQAAGHAADRGADRRLPRCGDGARALPDADILIADRGYDSDRFREALNARGPAPCIPDRANRKTPVMDDKALYKRRNLVERRFGRLKDWRRIATHHDRCAHTFFSAICIAAIFIFWL